MNQSFRNKYTESASVSDNISNDATVVDRMINVKQCAALLGCHVATIWRMSKDSSFPKPIKIGNLTRWSELDVQKFLAANTHND